MLEKHRVLTTLREAVSQGYFGGGHSLAGVIAGLSRGNAAFIINIGSTGRAADGSRFHAGTSHIRNHSIGVVDNARVAFRELLLLLAAQTAGHSEGIIGIVDRQAA